MPIFLRRTPFLIVFLAVVCWRLLLTLAATDPNAGGSSSIELAPGAASGVARRGGQLTATLRTEPRSFNRLFAPDPATKLVTTLTQAALVRVNQVTHELEPWLAERCRETVRQLSCRTALRPPSPSRPHLFRRRAVHFGRRGLHLSGAVRPEGRQSARRGLQDRRQTPRGDRDRRPHFNIGFPAPHGPGLRWLESLRSCRATSSRRRGRKASSATPGPPRRRPPRSSASDRSS